nr:fibronectin type III domain-containing protein [Candidatus Sigynarchaeota archaeon]
MKTNHRIATGMVLAFLAIASLAVPPRCKTTRLQNDDINGSAVPGKPIITSAVAYAYRVDLTWTIACVTPHNPLYFDLYWGYSADTCYYWECTIGYFGCPGQVEYTDTGLVVGTTYYYRVYASNSDGNGPWSSVVNATIPYPPDAPTDLAAAGADDQVLLSWTAPDFSGTYPITNYKVFRSTTPDTEILIAKIENQWSWTDTGAINGVRYYYKVCAVTGAGNGALSDEASAMPAGPPRAPQNLEARAAITRCHLAWDAPASNCGFPITNYTIYRGTLSSPGQLVATIGNVTNYTDGGLVNGENYFYRVRAVNAAGLGDATGDCWVQPGVPSRVQDVVADGGYNRIVLTWQAPSVDGGAPITSYKIYREMEGSWNLIAVTGNVTTYTDSSVEIDRVYYYRVSAVNGIMESEMSTEVYASASLDPLIVFWSIFIGIVAFIALLSLVRFARYRGRIQAAQASERERIQEARAKRAARIETMVEAKMMQLIQRQYRQIFIKRFVDELRNGSVSLNITKNEVLAVLERKVAQGILEPCESDDDDSWYEFTKAGKRAYASGQESIPSNESMITKQQSAAEKKAVKAQAAPVSIDKDKKSIPKDKTMPPAAVPKQKEKSKFAPKPTDAGTIINRTILKDYIERMRKEGVKELHYLKIKNDLNIISQNKSSKLYRLLQELVSDNFLVRKGSNYIIVG